MEAETDLRIGRGLCRPGLRRDFDALAADPRGHRSRRSRRELGR